MKPIVLLPLALILAAATSFGVATLFGDGARPVVEAHDPADAEREARTIADLESRLTALAKSVEDLRADVATRTRESARVPIGDIEAAVARALERSGAPDKAPATDAAPAVASAKSGDAKAAFEELMKLGWEEAQAKWKEIADAGGIDEMVAMFEQYAKENPDSPDAQVELGEAYLQKVFRSGNGPETGLWATKADGAFDAALALDDHHWNARFSKAISLSFWPPVFGKQTEAIKHFETLTEQQSGMPSNPDHAQTWLLLGNLYQQIGKSDQALATWQKGLSLFPGNSQLQQQIANANSGH